jgi:hypothetical protein
MSTVNNRPGTPLVTQLDYDDEIYAMRVVSDKAELVRAAIPAVFASGQGSYLMPHLRSGNLYHRIPTGTGRSTGSTSITDGVGNWIPFMVPKACTLTEIGCEVLTAGAAGAVMRFGIWAENPTAPGLPAALIQDFGTVATTSVANAVITGLTVALQPYVLYFLSHHYQGAVSPQASIGVWGAASAFGSTNLSNYVWSTPQGTITGAYPASATPIVSTGSGGGAPASTWVRLSL